MVNIREHQGEIVLYHWVEALRTFIDEKFTDNSQNKVDEQSNVDQIIETGERFFFLVLFFFIRFYAQSMQWEIVFGIFGCDSFSCFK